MMRNIKKLLILFELFVKVNMMLNVHRNHEDYKDGETGRRAEGGMEVGER